MARSGIAAALGELAQGAGFKREDKDLLKALDRELSALRECWGIDVANGTDVARRIILLNLNAHIKRLDPRPARQGLSVEQRRRQFENALRISFNIVEDMPGVTDLNLMKRQGTLETADDESYRIGLESCQRDFDYAIREIEKQIVTAGYAPIKPQPEIRRDFPVAENAKETSSQASASNADGAGRLPDRLQSHNYLRPRIALPASAGALALIAALIFVFKHDGSPPTPTPSPSVSTSTPVPPVLASFVQYPPPVPDYNNAWVLPQVLPASDATHLTSLGFVSAIWAPQMGGHLVADGNYRVTLTGEAADGLTITNIMAVVVKRAAPLTGTFIDIGGQGMNSNQQFMFKLDQSPAEALFGDPTNQAYGQPVFAGNNISLAKAESMTINVEAQAHDADYQFKLQFTVVVDGKEQTVTVSGIDGKPFEVTGIANSYPIVFTHSSNFKSIVSLGQVTDCPKQCP